MSLGLASRCFCLLNVVKIVQEQEQVQEQVQVAEPNPTEATVARSGLIRDFGCVWEAFCGLRALH